MSRDRPIGGALERDCAQGCVESGCEVWRSRGTARWAARRARANVGGRGSGGLGGLVAAESAAEATDEVEHAELEGRLVWAALRDGERLADAVEEAEGTAESAGVALTAIGDVEAEFLALAVLVEVEVVDLGRELELLPCGRLSEEGAGVRGENSRVEPDSPRVERVDAEAVISRVGVEGGGEVEGADRVEVLALVDRADDGGAELEVFREALAVVEQADTLDQDVLRQGDELLRRDGERRLGQELRFVEFHRNSRTRRL
mmetsp:Transcript_2746/g.8648  ORF Transcript_2746/g.8648 Transcript_2746/m.8648 type:complete len:260 (-) Transcript_2746:145-924(-)